MDGLTTCSARAFLVGPVEAATGFAKLLDAGSFEHTRFETPSGVLRQLRRESAVDLVILTPDASFDSYAELCRHIKFDVRTAFVSVIFVLPPEDAERCVDAYEAGANNCIKLPASSEEILIRLSNTLRAKRATDSLEDSTAVITSLASAIEGRDAYTHGHVERVSTYSVEIGSRVGVTPDDLAVLKIGGVVHDIGKVAVPDNVLNKPGGLDDVEMEFVKRHTLMGYDILQPLRTFRAVLPIVRWHHERPNGRGYPDALVGDELPLLPRIVAVADVFDALSTTRPYRPALSPSECREILSKAAENEDLDSSLVAILLDILGESMPDLTGVPAESGVHMWTAAPLSPVPHAQANP